MKQYAKYAFIRCIGRGGMSEVWIGKSYGSGGFEKTVAIKLLSKEQIDKACFQRALTDEAILSTYLKHPNIVDVYDLHLDGEKPFVVMEYIEGIELRDLMTALRDKNAILPLSVTAYIISEISKALSYAHSRCDFKTQSPLRIVHRDVSPSNILVSKEGEVKLTDFGIAKSAIQSAKTQTGVIKGKFRYMSPEQARGEAIDFRSDIFSLGLVFYECLFGRPAYDAPTEPVLLATVQKGEINLPHDVDLELKGILAKLIAPDPKGRYADLQIFRKDLTSHMKSHGGIIDREDFSEFLLKLSPPQLKETSEHKKYADKWTSTSESMVIDETGQYVELDQVKEKHSRRYYAIGGVFLLVIVAAVSAYFIIQSPPAPQGRAALQSVTAPQTPAKTAPPAPAQIKSEIDVSFVANPYADVTISGHFSDLRTPFGQRLDPGTYTVIFFHPASQRRVTATLSAPEGGNFTCSASILAGDPSEPPSAVCSPR